MKKILVFAVVVLCVGAVVILTRDSSIKLTDQHREILGAAAIVPAETSAYSSCYDLWPRLKNLWKSRAVKRLMTLPLAQQGLMQVQMSPQFQQFRAIIQTHPVAVGGLPILTDAFSSETFIAADNDFPGFAEAMLAVYGAARIVNTQQQLGRWSAPPAHPLSAMVEVILEEQEQLRVPGICFGFKLEDPGAAEVFLDTWLTVLLPALEGYLEKASDNDHEYFVLEADGNDLPAEMLQSMTMSVPRGAEVAKWLRSQTVAVTVGVIDDYLLIMVGEDRDAIHSWGDGPSLAETPAFQPLLERLRPELLGIQYASAEMASAFAWNEEDLEELRGLAPLLVSQLPAGDEQAAMAERLDSDLDALVDDMQSLIPEPGSMLAFSFGGNGVESFQLWERGELPVADLDILKHRGEHPIIATAACTARDDGQYDMSVKWLSTAYQYGEVFLLAQMNVEQRSTFESVKAIALPFLVTLDETTREYLIPAIDGTQSVFVFDGEGTLETLPSFDGEKSITPPQPIPLPRLGYAATLNDAKKFTKAMANYRDAINNLVVALRGIPAIASEMPPFQMPPMTKTQVADMTGYHVTLPVSLGDDMLPFALIGEHLLVLATSQTLAMEMAQAGPEAASDVVDIASDAGMISIGNYAPLWAFCERLSESLTAIAAQEMPQGEAASLGMVKIHVAGLIDALKALRGHATSARMEGPYLLQHTWLDVRDID